jgi:hypothetical protein
MTPDERVMELQEIFARGVVRALLISGTRGSHSGQQALTGSALQSDECATPPAEVNQMISGGIA